MLNSFTPAQIQPIWARVCPGRKIRILSCATLVAFLQLASGCGGGGSGAASAGSQNPTLQSIVVSPSGPTIALGQSVQLTATGNYSDGSARDLSTQATWTSDANSVGVVSVTGVVSAVAMGSAKVTATLGAVSGGTNLTVNAATLQSIYIYPGNSYLPTGLTVQLVAHGHYSDGSSKDITSTVTWTTATSPVLTVSAAGQVATLTTGTVDISATAGNVVGKVAFTITSDALQSITVTPQTVSTPVGYAGQLTASAIFVSGVSRDVTSAVTWSSGASSIATVDATGIVTGLTLGSSTISASLGGVLGKGTVNVVPATLQTIIVSTYGSSLPVGLSGQAVAMGKFADGSTEDVTSSVSWSSDSKSVATVSQKGIVTGVSAGSSNIIATMSGVTGSVSITVSPAAAAPAVSVSPLTLAVFLPGNCSQLFTVTNVGPKGSQLIYFVADNIKAPGLRPVVGVAGGDLLYSAQLGILPASGSTNIAVSAAPQLVGGSPTLVGLSDFLEVYTPQATNFILLNVGVDFYDSSTLAQYIVGSAEGTYNEVDPGGTLLISDEGTWTLTITDFDYYGQTMAGTLSFSGKVTHGSGTSIVDQSPVSNNVPMDIKSTLGFSIIGNTATYNPASLITQLNSFPVVIDNCGRVTATIGGVVIANGVAAQGYPKDTTLYLNWDNSGIGNGNVTGVITFPFYGPPVDSSGNQTEYNYHVRMNLSSNTR